MSDFDKDEYNAWRDSAVTRWVFAAILQAAEDKRDDFLNLFFYGDTHDPAMAGYMRGEFSTLMSIQADELTYERVVAMHESKDIRSGIDLYWASPRGEKQ